MRRHANSSQVKIDLEREWGDNFEAKTPGIIGCPAFGEGLLGICQCRGKSSAIGLGLTLVCFASDLYE